MKKKSAMVVAAGLAVALLAATVALSMSLSGGGTAQAETTKHSKPIVRTVHRTVTIHKDAKASGEATVQVVSLSDSSTMSGSSSGSDAESSDDSDDSYESESSDDSEDSYESETFDDSQSGDTPSSDSGSESGGDD